VVFHSKPKAGGVASDRRRVKTEADGLMLRVRHGTQGRGPHSLGNGEGVCEFCRVEGEAPFSLRP
jgi:hypothetical protein